MFERTLRMLGAAVVIAALCGAGSMHAQDATAGCMLDHGVYQCSWSAFKDTLASAKTVSVQSDPMDERTNDALKRLARKLGKTVVEAGDQPADLQLLLIPLNKNGIYVGPADEDLGTLRIYAGGTATQRGTLVWAETYRGKKDIPWPSVVYYTIHQFEEKLGGGARTGVWVK